MGADMLLGISFKYTFSDWSKEEVTRIQKCVTVISLDGAIVMPVRSRVYVERSESETFDLERW